MSGRHNGSTHNTAEREYWRIKKRGEQRTEKTAGSRDKEVSVVENIESDIKVMQFNLKLRDAWMRNLHTHGEERHEKWREDDRWRQKKCEKQERKKIE